MKSNLLSLGNKKISRTVGIFNLPPGDTCPGKTAFCAEICYANKSNKQYKNARERRKVNLELTRQPDFAALMTADIALAKLKYIRIHESGDFYDQPYLDKWIEIATTCSDTTFLAYTKSFQLNFKAAPVNMKILYSIDTTTVRLPPKTGRHTALTLQKGVTSCPGRYVCMPVGKDRKGNKQDHYGYCDKTCKFCWEDRGDVAWILH